jgi:hypothetical protein
MRQSNTWVCSFSPVMQGSLSILLGCRRRFPSRDTCRGLLTWTLFLHPVPALGESCLDHGRGTRKLTKEPSNFRFADKCGRNLLMRCPAMTLVPARNWYSATVRKRSVTHQAEVKSPGEKQARNSSSLFHGRRDFATSADTGSDLSPNARSMVAKSSLVRMGFET